jgi:hypothetical protein
VEELQPAQKVLIALDKKVKVLWGSMVLAAAFALTIVMIGGANGKDIGVNIRDWRQLNMDEKGCYAAGFSDGFAVGSVMGTIDPQRAKKIRCRDRWTFGQCAAIIDKYLQDNPHKWDMDFAILVWEAWEDACKKRGYPNQ